MCFFLRFYDVEVEFSFNIFWIYYVYFICEFFCGGNIKVFLVVDVFGVDFEDIIVSSEF